MTPRAKILEWLKVYNNPEMESAVFTEIDEIENDHNDKFCHIRPIWVWVIVTILGLGFGALFALCISQATSLADERWDKAYVFSEWQKSLRQCNKKNY